MGRDLEKGIKRFLKRRVKITLGFIVAFLLSCSFAMGEGLVITEDGNGKILFNGEIFDEENHKFTGNTFDGNTYINNNELDVLTLKNLKTFTFENKSIFTSLNIDNTIDSDITIKNKGIAISEENPIFYISENSDIKEIENNGILNTEMNYILYNEGGKVDKVTNNGIAFNLGYPEGTDSSFVFLNSKAGTINNSGILSSVNSLSTIWSTYIFIPGFEAPDRYSDTSIEEIINTGSIMNIMDFGNSYAIRLEVYDSSDKDMDNKIINKGKIIAISNFTDSSSIIYDYNLGKTYLENTGILFSKFPKKEVPSNIGTINNGKEIINYGVISKENGVGISNFENLINCGIISADIPILNGNDKVENYGLYLSEEGEILKYDEQSGEFTAETSKTESSTEIADIGKTVINAGSNEQGFAQSIKSETIRDLLADTGYILNGYDKTVVLNSVTENKDINNSVINAVKNAVTFEGDNLTLGLNNTTVNGGYGEDIISGDTNANNLNLSGETIINGNVNLNGGNDKMSLDNTVQINGTLDGGAGDEDILTFNSSVTKSSSDKNINILYDIKGFEKTDIDTNVTLFEKTVNDNGDVKNLVAGLGDITIQNNGKLTLRVDGTEKDGDKIIGHALYRNDGSLQTEETGKLVLGLYGVGNEAVVAFGGTKIENLNSDNVETSSYLHSVKVNGSENVIEVSAKKDLEDLDIANYDKLNKIYHSILNSQNLDKFTVGEEQKGAFFKYLHDIYAGNPYAYSSELSRKTMGMMRNLADRDLHPELNKWSIYGGLSHIDGGTKESFYGRNYYGYDTGSRDIETDTKITGGYFKAEYGKSDSVTTGIIFGGNNAESEIGNSKAEGDSFYFGGYAKKFVNDFRFTLGAGFQHGDYKSDRTAVGYEGILKDKTSQKYDSNYHDRGFDIYGDIKYSREFGNGLFFEPGFTLSYTYLDQDGAAENGTLAIETDSKNFDYLSSEINLDVRKTFAKDKLTHSFIAGISYERLLNGYDEEYITGRVIGGTDFDILVPEKEKDNFLLNVKYELETEKGMLFDVKYSYRFEHDNNQDEWTVGAGVGYKF